MTKTTVFVPMPSISLNSKLHGSHVLKRSKILILSKLHQKRSLIVFRWLFRKLSRIDSVSTPVFSASWKSPDTANTYEANFSAVDVEECNVEGLEVLSVGCSIGSSTFYREYLISLENNSESAVNFVKFNCFSQLDIPRGDGTSGPMNSKAKYRVPYIIGSHSSVAMVPPFRIAPGEAASFDIELYPEGGSGQWDWMPNKMSVSLETASGQNVRVFSGHEAY